MVGLPAVIFYKIHRLELRREPSDWVIINATLQPFTSGTLPSGCNPCASLNSLLAGWLPLFEHLSSRMASIESDLPDWILARNFWA